MVDIERLKLDESLWPDGPVGCWVVTDDKGCFVKSLFVYDPRDSATMNENPRAKYIPRPEPEWDGGLPSVGCECEVNLYGWWVVATVLAYGKSKFLYEIAEGQIDQDGDPLCGEHGGSIMQAKFRPIRTKAERDREELCEITSKYSDLGHVIADDILAAGWQKPD